MGLRKTQRNGQKSTLSFTLKDLQTSYQHTFEHWTALESYPTRIETHRVQRHIQHAEYTKDRGLYELRGMKHGKMQ